MKSQASGSAQVLHGGTGGNAAKPPGDDKRRVVVGFRRREKPQSVARVANSAGTVFHSVIA